VTSRLLGGARGLAPDRGCDRRRLPEGAAHVSDQVGVLETRQWQRGRETVGTEHDALQIALDHLREHALSITNDYELTNGLSVSPPALSA